MPSPFPGMDPCLEDPALWPDVHHRFIDVASEMLQAQIRPGYFVQIEERRYLASESDVVRGLIVPDLRVREVDHTSGEGSQISASGLAIAPGIALEEGWELEIREGRFEVIDRDSRRVITVVEILRPANKINPSAGRKSYEDKRNEILSTDTHLVEIDLLRQGIPLTLRSDLPPHDYMVQVSRPGRKRHRRTVWPIPLRDRLPVIPSPLKHGDPDAALDLQAMLDTAYDRAGYDLRVDYSDEPIVKLSAVASRWADGVLIEKRLRSA